MRIVVIILFVIVDVGIIFSQESSEHNKEGLKVNWETSFTKALAKSKSENKPILIYFSGSDWCGPCIRLDKELFHTRKFIEFTKDKLVLYLADFPRNKDLVTKQGQQDNKRLAENYNNSFPMVLIIDADEKILGEKRGVYMTEYYYPFFDSVLSNYN